MTEQERMENMAREIRALRAELKRLVDDLHKLFEMLGIKLPESG